MIYPVHLAIDNNRHYQCVSKSSNTKISFGESDYDGGSYSYCRETSKESEKTRIESEYNKKFHELCNIADEIDMNNEIFWKLAKELSAEKARKLDCLND